MSIKWQYALWFILIVRLVVPWTPKTSFSIYNIIPYFSNETTQPVSQTKLDQGTILNPVEKSITTSLEPEGNPPSVVAPEESLSIIS